MEEGTQKRLEYDRIKEEVDKLGISLSELCRQSDVQRNVLHRWKGDNPKTIDILHSLSATIDKLKEEQTNKNK